MFPSVVAAHGQVPRRIRWPDLSHIWVGLRGALKLSVGIREWGCSIQAPVLSFVHSHVKPVSAGIVHKSLIVMIPLPTKSRKTLQRKQEWNFILWKLPSDTDTVTVHTFITCSEIFFLLYSNYCACFCGLAETVHVIARFTVLYGGFTSRQLFCFFLSFAAVQNQIFTYRRPVFLATGEMFSKWCHIFVLLC